MKKLVLILLCLPIIGFGQCDKRCDEIINYTNAIYSGCKNDDNQEDGYGELIFNDGRTSYKGCWKDGRKYGQGTYDWGDGRKYVGNWKDGEFYGQGIYEFSDKSTEEGIFKNNILWDGILTFSGEDGVIYKVTRKEGNPTDTITNDKNHYVKNDIIGDDLFCIKNLIQKKNKFEIICNINNMSVKWFFDTGADGISISKREWDRIKSKIEFEDLNIIKRSQGVGGFRSGKMVRIIDKINIGCYSVKNTIVFIADGDYSLMGIGFFDKFSNVEWNMKESHLKLYK